MTDKLSVGSTLSGERAVSIEEGVGRVPTAPGLRGFAPEPPTASQPEALVPSRGAIAMTWTQEQAVSLCRKVEAICPRFGCHVALTGGALYKDGPRKDADILFYRIRQVDAIDVDGLFSALATIGVQKVGGFGWCHKAEFEGRKIDCFFPEDQSGEYVRDDSEAAQEIRAEVAEWKADRRRDNIMMEAFNGD